MMLQYGCKNNQNNNNDNTNKNKKKREKKKKKTVLLSSKPLTLSALTDDEKEKWQGPHETIKIGKEQKNRGIIPWPPVTPVKTGA